MEAITHSQVQEVVRRLPTAKLPAAFNFLNDLVEREPEKRSPQSAFFNLPLSQRRNILAQQAQQLKEHYEQTAHERQTWQAGDFRDED